MQEDAPRRPRADLSRREPACRAQELAHKDRSEILQAVCAFAKDLEGAHRFSGAEVDVTRFRGKDFNDDIVALKRFVGSVPAQMRSLWESLGALIEDEAQPERGMVAEFIPTYPLDALKELARNML